jgi:hypothetical protein
VVNGFVGGVYNDFGDYRMIRQADAHSWVEVWFPGLGWRTFDPTPPAGQGAPSEEGAAAWLSRVIDGTRMVWIRWIVEYDLERQVDVFREAWLAMKRLRRGGSELGGLFQGAGRLFEATPGERPAGEAGPLPWPWLVLGSGLAGLVAILWAWRRRRRLGVELDPALARIRRRVDRALARLGLPRRSWETWLLVAQRLEPRDQAAAAALRQFGAAWDVARYRRRGIEAARPAVLASGEAVLDRLRWLRGRPNGRPAGRGWAAA